MYTKQKLDVVGTYSADTVRDEDLLSMAKYMYKEGLLKASVKYDPDTDSNIMENNVIEIAEKLGVPVVPYMGQFTIYEAIEFVRKGFKFTIAENNLFMFII